MKNMFDSNILVKVGEFNHLKDLVENGTLYMTPLREFRKIQLRELGIQKKAICSLVRIWRFGKRTKNLEPQILKLIMA